MVKLQLNTDKTELLLIGTKQQLQKINMSTLCVGNDLITPSKEIKNLGVWLYPSLTMNTHINKTCSIAFYQLYNLRRIHEKYLLQESVEILIHILIYRRIDYCNSLYLGYLIIKSKKFKEYRMPQLGLYIMSVNTVT